MDLNEARTLARDLMHGHGLDGWSFAYDRAKTRAGMCRYDRRLISLSRHLTLLHSAEQVRDTILHEIAHALAGPNEGHGPGWRAMAARLGARPHRTLSPDAPVPAAPWQGQCPGGHRHRRFRRPKQPVSCARCCPRFCPASLVHWEFHGESVHLGDVYDLMLRHAVSGEACRTCGGSAASNQPRSLPA